LIKNVVFTVVAEAQTWAVSIRTFLQTVNRLSDCHIRHSQAGNSPSLHSRNLEPSW